MPGARPPRLPLKLFRFKLTVTSLFQPVTEGNEPLRELLPMSSVTISGRTQDPFISVGNVPLM